MTQRPTKKLIVCILLIDLLHNASGIRENRG